MDILTLVERGRDRLRKKGRKFRARMQERLRPVVRKTRGFCPICERATTFVARDPWLRDHYKCRRCRSIPRERALMRVLQQNFPDWSRLDIHESSPANRGVSARLADECPGYVASHFYADAAPGSIVHGYRCENLERMTFANESVDLHVTQDVFEHLLRPARAFAEVARTLRPGGAHIFTVPLVKKDSATAMRIALTDAGGISHLAPPEYHGNPIDAKGSLVTVDWGYDIAQFIERTSGLATQIIRLDAVDLGIEGEYTEVLVTRKPQVAAAARV